MIGVGLKKLAQKHGMRVSSGIAFGSMRGYAVTLSEGAGYKRLDVSAIFPEAGKKEELMDALMVATLKREYRVQNVGFGKYNISIIFQDTVGTMKKIEAFIEWFLPLLSQHGATGADICPQCMQQVTQDSWYVIGGIAHHLHDSCAEHIQSAFDQVAEQHQQEDTGSYLRGALGAVVGAFLGAAVWAILLSIGFIASLVGFLIGWLAERGYTLLKGKQGKGKIVILIVAIILGVLLGTILPDVVTLAQMINEGSFPGYTYADIPSLLMDLVSYDAEYVQAMVYNTGLGLLFAAIGVFALLKKTNKEVSTAKIRKLK